MNLILKCHLNYMLYTMVMSLNLTKSVLPFLEDMIQYGHF